MKSPFSYVVLRYMHDVFTREFVNVAVVVACPKAGFVKMKATNRFKRALGFFPGMDRGDLSLTLRFLKTRIDSYHETGQQTLPFQEFDAAAISRAVLPADDSSLQWSAPGGGITEDPALVLEELFERLVARHEEKHPAVRRSDEQVWQPFEAALKTYDNEILSRLQVKELSAGSFKYRFDHTWQPANGPLHLLLPLSFDLMDASDIVDKAVKWNGRVSLLRKSTPDFKAYLLLGKPTLEMHAPAFNQAATVLTSENDPSRIITPEDRAASFASEFHRSVIDCN